MPTPESQSDFSPSLEGESKRGWSISYDKLSKEVRPYADNLEAQVWTVFRKYGVARGVVPRTGAADELPRYNPLEDLKAKNPSTEDLEHLADLLEQLDHIRKTGTPLERTKRELGETLLTITVKDAVNPYREALLEGGIPEGDEATLEKKDLTYNLKEVLEADIASYRAVGLEGWAKALEELITPSSPPYLKGDVGLSSPPTPPLRIRGGREGLCLTPEQRKIIEAELKEGAIPIFIPGASTQLETTPKQYQTGFKPVSIKEGTLETTEPAYLWAHLQDLISSEDPSLSTNLPERPYLLLIKPTQKPDERTTKKTVTEQQAELETINQERRAADLSPVFSIKPLEYAALQQRFTEQVATLTPPSPGEGEGKGGGVLATLYPLDRRTWTRFIDLPLSSIGRSLFGSWNPGVRRLGFGDGDADWGDPWNGFRFAVRVEI